MNFLIPGGGDFLQQKEDKRLYLKKCYHLKILHFFAGFLLAFCRFFGGPLPVLWRPFAGSVIFR
jgi:hypothetical protein